MDYAYKESLMKRTIGFFNLWYINSDKYGIALSIIYVIPMFIVGVIVSLIIDF